MSIDAKVAIQQIDSVLTEWLNLRGEFEDAPDFQVSKYSIRLIALIERLTPSESPYSKNAQSMQKDYGINSPSGLRLLVGIVQAIREDYAAGYLQSIEELIHADLFSDFLEMADYFLKEGYKDPAAVITGGVLEEHLRQLCQKNGISQILSSSSGNRPKKADSMNSELTGAGVYTKLDQKSVTAWLDLRNNAAHGKYSEYTKEQVGLMVQGIRDFILRHPA